MAIRVHHRTGITTPVEEGQSPGLERADGRNPNKQRAIWQHVDMIQNLMLFPHLGYLQTTFILNCTPKRVNLYNSTTWLHLILCLSSLSNHQTVAFIHKQPQDEDRWERVEEDVKFWSCYYDIEVVTCGKWEFHLYFEPQRRHTHFIAWQQHDTNDRSRSRDCVGGCFCNMGT